MASARIIQRDGILDHVRQLGEYAIGRLEELMESCPRVGDVRGKGLLIGIEIVDPETGVADGKAAAQVQRRALEQGLIIELGGRDDAVVRLLPPLNVSRDTLDDALEILERAVHDAPRQENGKP